MATASDVAKYFLYLDEMNDGEGISNLKVQKLTYYAQGYHLAIFGNPLFGESISAWAHGPVVETLYHAFKQHGRDHIPALTDFNPNVFSEDEKELLDEIYEVYGQFSAWKLRNMTHEEAPWIDHESSGGVIPKAES